MRRRRLLIAAVVVLVGALALDQGARVLAEHRVAARIAGQGVSATGVHLSGWPFLVGLATGDVEARVMAQVPFAALAAALDHAAEGGSAPAAAARVTWSGEGGYLVARLDSGIALALSLGVADGAVRIEPAAVLVGGVQLPVDAVRDRAPRRLAGLLEPRTVDPAELGRLPAGTRVESVSVTADGLLVTLVAHEPLR